ncbi:MAG: hypothetical protein ABIH67_05510 [Candidatus Uhrbacteria bacterium]
MRYRIPENVLEARIYQTGPAVIIAEEGESLQEIAVAIAKLAIEQASSPGFGAIAEAGRVRNGIPLISDEDLAELAAEASAGKIDIDYWKGGRCVKLILKAVGDRLELSIAVWTDRWDVMSPTTPDYAIVALRELLDSVVESMKS